MDVLELYAFVRPARFCAPSPTGLALSLGLAEPKSAEEQRVMQFLREDPQMRTAFFNKVSGPIVNKMFECGMIP